jgi:hypothetical protein
MMKQALVAFILVFSGASVARAESVRIPEEKSATPGTVGAGQATPHGETAVKSDKDGSKETLEKGDDVTEEEVVTDEDGGSDLQEGEDEGEGYDSEEGAEEGAEDGAE